MAGKSAAVASRMCRSTITPPPADPAPAARFARAKCLLTTPPVVIVESIPTDTLIRGRPAMLPHQEYAQAMTRRHFFRQGALGLGGAALASLVAESNAAAPMQKQTHYGGLDSLPQFPPKAKRAIYLYMSGGPAQMDLCHYKPKMEA